MYISIIKYIPHFTKILSEYWKLAVDIARWACDIIYSTSSLSTQWKLD